MEKNQKRIKPTPDFEKLLQQTLRFLGIRPRSRKEIKSYLQKKSSSLKMQKKIFDYLGDMGMVNDAEFVLWWLEQRIFFRPKGKKALSSELRQKGVAKDLIEEMIAKKIDELSLVRQLIKKKWPFFQKLPFLEARQKMSAFLFRRGFSWEIIKKGLEEIKPKR